MTIAILAGEVSGDQYGALLAHQLRDADRRVTLIGTGGARMREAGVSFLTRMPAPAMGISDVAARLPAFHRAFQRTVGILRAHPPHLLVLIDNPGFNLRLADTLGPRIPCWYYIPPKIWAHGYRRIRTMRRSLRGVIAAFSFEQALYQREGIPCAWFGHPVVDLVPPVPDTTPLRNLCDTGPIAGFLPGSRRGEITRIMPPFLTIARLVSTCGLRPIFSAVDGEATTLIQSAMVRAGTSFPITTATYALMKESRVLASASGTANLEAALYGTPQVICHRLGTLNYLVARRVVQLPVASPVNIVLNERAIPEYIQHIPTREVADHLLAVAKEGPARTSQTAAFIRIRTALGTGPVARTAAQFLLDQCSKNT